MTRRGAAPAKGKESSLMKELKKIEEEERVIETEEKIIEQRQAVLRTLEELGLMRWRSYYVLTAGAILLLALTFVTSLWVMNDQLMQVQDSINTVKLEVQEVQTSVQILQSEITDLDLSLLQVSQDLERIQNILSSFVTLAELPEQI